MFSYMVKNHIEIGGRALIFTHRKELLTQAGGAFERFNLNPEYIEAGKEPDLTKNLHVSMIETFHRRLDRYRLFLDTRTMIIVDECHINSFTKVLENINSKETYVIGATATPYRKGKSIPELKEFYQDIVQNVNIKDLIDRKFLAKPKSYGVPIDMEKMKKKGDDYDTSQYYQENKMWTGVLDNWERLTPNTKTILFSSNVKSSKEVCAEFIKRGYDAKHIDGATPKKEREEILKWFDESKNGVICNCGILTTGYDQPDIETVILYRATTSLPLFLQMCGRGSRVTETKKEFNILDFGNNIKRLGFWEQERKWSLSNDNKRSSKESIAPTKECLECEAILHASVMTCPYCEYKFKRKAKEVKKAELKLLTYNEIKSKINDGLGISEMEEIRVAKGYKVNWLVRQLENIPQLEEYASLKGYKPAWVRLTAKRMNLI